MEATESVMRPAPDYVLVPRSTIEALLDSLDLPTPAPVDYDPSEFLAEFEQACKIDYRLHSLTIRERTRHVKRLLKFLDKHPLHATRPELRQFLALNPAQNAVKALRVLYGRFLGSDLASCFTVPQSPPRIVVVPIRDQLWNTFERLNTLELRAAFLLLATSGLRRHELMELTPAQIDLENRTILPSTSTTSTTKLQWATCFNAEAKAALQELLLERRTEVLGTSVLNTPRPDERIFTLYKDTLTRKLKRASSPAGFKITPQVLRDWFCNELGRLGVQDRYVDAFCGRIPRRVLGRHYTDYSPERLKEIYDRAGLRVFDRDLIARAGEGERGFAPKPPFHPPL